MKRVDESQPLNSFCYQAFSDLSLLPDVLAWFEQTVSPFLSSVVFLQCQTALAEGFTNAVRHAHSQLPPQTTISIEVFLLERYIEIRVFDQGQPFDLVKKIQQLSNLEESTDLLLETGRGLYFMKQLTDDMDYVRMHNSQNCLILRKSYCPPLI